MGIQDTHKMILFLLDKAQMGFVSHEEIDNALQIAQMQRFMELYGNIKDYQPGRPIPRVAYGMTQKVHDELRNFKEEEFFVTASNGLVNFSGLSSSYAHLIALRGSYVDSSNTINHFMIKVLSEDQIAQRLTSQIVAPTTYDPVALIGKSSIQLFPDQVHKVTVYYLRLPNKPKYSYTMSSDGRTVIFDSSTSVDLEFPDTSYNDILMKALNILSVNAKDAFVNQYSELKNQQGV
jgi:hypothetical protein